MERNYKWGKTMSVSQKYRMLGLINERSLLTSGFRTSLRGIVKEYIENEYDEIPDDIEEELDCVFTNWFGETKAFPFAYRIVRNNDVELNGILNNLILEVYEVETSSKEVSPSKWSYWGQMADREGPLVELHIIDKYDNELVINNDTLECFWMACEDWSYPYIKELLKDVRSLGIAQHHTAIIIDNAKINVLEGELEKLKNEITIPVKEKHKQWKIAYDAISELGIKL